MPPDLLERAIAAMGGRETLSHVKALLWTGMARVETGPKPLEIEISTRMEPFRRARSETKLVGTDEVRTLIIEPDGGWVEQNGTRAPLPANMATHEREQYGLYGYMLLTQAPTRIVGDHLVAELPGLPPAALLFEGDYVTAADYAVAAPDGNGTVQQRILLEGEMRDRGIRWPQTITILHNDEPYFTLDLDSFTAELA